MEIPLTMTQVDPRWKPNNYGDFNDPNVKAYYEDLMKKYKSGFPLSENQKLALGQYQNHLAGLTGGGSML